MSTASGMMAKKKMGRPKSSDRDDASIKFDRVLANRARMVAHGRGTSMTEYLSEMCRATINRDYAKLMKDLESGDQ